MSIQEKTQSKQQQKKEVKAVIPAWQQRWKERSALQTGEISLNAGRLQTWLTYFDFHYARHAEQWDYIADHLEGRVLDYDRIDKYLVQKYQGETNEAFQERMEITNYTPDFLNAVLTLAGMLFGKEDAVTRSWKADKTESLGDPAEDGDFRRFWLDCDGEGTNYENFLFNLAKYIIAYGEVWILIEGWQKTAFGTRIPQLKLIAPQNVYRAIYDADGILDSVKTLSYVESSNVDQKAKPGIMELYTIYYRDGFETWKHSKDGVPEQVSKDRKPYGDKGFQFMAKNKATVPPLFKVKLPFDTPIGWMMVKIANTLFNHGSSLDYVMHLAGFPKLAADVVGTDGTVNSELMDKIAESFKQGSSLIYGKGSHFIEPSMTAAKLKGEMIKEKRRDFYTTFFQSYGDQAAQKTATEIRQDFAMGVQAFLSLMAQTLEEAENTIMYRLEQIFFPSKPKLWGVTSVLWDKDFSQSEDPLKKITELVNRTIAPAKELLPVDTSTKEKVLQDFYDLHGYALDDKQKAELQAQLSSSDEASPGEESLEDDEEQNME